MQVINWLHAYFILHTHEINLEHDVVLNIEVPHHANEYIFFNIWVRAD